MRGPLLLYSSSRSYEYIVSAPRTYLVFIIDDYRLVASNEVDVSCIHERCLVVHSADACGFAVSN